MLEKHLAFARRVTPPGHVHALDVDALMGPDITFFSVRRKAVLLGVGAVKRLSPAHAELKSMHTSESARRQGVASALVAYLLAFAAASGYERVSLETGTMEAFEPARALYSKFGFVPCQPFGSYTANPYSTCMTMPLPAGP